MKLHDIGTPEDLQVVAERMWEIVRDHYPEQAEVMNQVIADQRLDRFDLLHMGFNFGAAFALSEFAKGHIKEIKGGNG